MELSYENPTAYMTCGSSALVKFETHLFDYERYGIPSYEGTFEGTKVPSKVRRYLTFSYVGFRLVIIS